MKSRAAGFSLIEVMLSVALGAIVFYTVHSVLAQTTLFAQGTAYRLESESEMLRAQYMLRSLIQNALELQAGGATLVGPATPARGVIVNGYDSAGTAGLQTLAIFKREDQANPTLAPLGSNIQNTGIFFLPPYQDAGGQEYSGLLFIDHGNLGSLYPRLNQGITLINKLVSIQIRNGLSLNTGMAYQPLSRIDVRLTFRYFTVSEASKNYCYRTDCNPDNSRDETVEFSISLRNNTMGLSPRGVGEEFLLGGLYFFREAGSANHY